MAGISCRSSDRKQNRKSTTKTEKHRKKPKNTENHRRLQQMSNLGLFFSVLLGCNPPPPPPPPPSNANNLMTGHRHSLNLKAIDQKAVSNVLTSSTITDSKLNNLSNLNNFFSTSLYVGLSILAFLLHLRVLPAGRIVNLFHFNSCNSFLTCEIYFCAILIQYLYNESPAYFNL